MNLDQNGKSQGIGDVDKRARDFCYNHAAVSHAIGKMTSLTIGKQNDIQWAAYKGTCIDNGNLFGCCVLGWLRSVRISNQFDIFTSLWTPQATGS